MAKKRPFGITLLAILAVIAALLALVHTLQMLHLLPFRLFGGQVKFFTFDLLGAILWGVMFLIWLWVFRMLWSVSPQGWLFVVALSAINLIIAIASVLGQTTFQEVLPAIVVNGLVLIYGLLPGTKAAFNVQS